MTCLHQPIPSRWAQTVFANPRVLHFHTCGTGPPGEICWMVIDPTVTIDGVALWENGRLHPDRFARTMERSAHSCPNLPVPLPHRLAKLVLAMLA